MLRDISLQLLLLTFEHLEGLHRIYAAALRKLLCLELEKVVGHEVARQGSVVLLRMLLLQKVLFVDLAHHFRREIFAFFEI